MVMNEKASINHFSCVNACVCVRATTMCGVIVIDITAPCLNTHVISNHSSQRYYRAVTTISGALLFKTDDYLFASQFHLIHINLNLYRLTFYTG